MKALLVADNELVIENVSTVLKTAGYDIITYHALLKALDNIEEIAPHLIVISTKEYPRHWKTLAQYSTVPLGSCTPQVILYTDGAFDEEEQKKAEALNIRGYFTSVDVDGLDELRAILSEKDDIFSGALNEPANEVKPIEIPDDFAEAHAHDEKMLEEFVEEEIAHPGESLEKIGQQIETEVVRASSPMEAVAATEDDEEDIEEPEELPEDGAEAEEQPQAAPISVEDILKQNQSFNRFAEVPDIKTEEEAKSGGDKVYEFGDIKGRREDAGDLGKDPMDLWADIEAEEAGMVADDEPETELHFNPISVSLDELSNLKHVGPEDETAEAEHAEAEDAVGDAPAEPFSEEEIAAEAEADDDADDRLAEIDKLAQADEQEAGMNFRPLSESLAALENGEDLAAGGETEAVTEPEIVEHPEPDEPPLSISEDELLAARQKSQAETEAVARIYAPVEPVLSENLAPVDPSMAITEDDVKKARDTASVSISLDELMKAQKAAEGDREKRVQMETSVKEKMQKVAENAANRELDPENPVTVTQQEVDSIMNQNQATDTDLSWLSNENADEPEQIDEEKLDEMDVMADPTGEKAHSVAESMSDILRQNQFTMKNNIDWLAKENADEPEQIDTDDLDVITDPTGSAAHDVAVSMDSILDQNQKTDSDLEWLANENADEPEQIDTDGLDELTDPTGEAAHEVAESMQDILSQNQIMDRQLEWLSNENADEPEAPMDVADFGEPTGMSASERDANVQDIVTQNQTITKDQSFTQDMDKLQTMVNKLNILRSIVCTLILTNPETGALISGAARNFNRNQLEFTPDIPDLAKNFRDGIVIDNASLKTEDGIEAVSATVVSAAEPLIIAINRNGK